jgi:DNA mismatch endonuclease (patch repair protein)
VQLFLFHFLKRKTSVIQIGAEEQMDSFSRKKRSWIMAQVKSAGNKSTENTLLSMLRQFKITGWRRSYPLFGKPDFVFPNHNVAVFVDGCFWHGHPQKCRVPQANREYWLRKIARNVARDRLVTRTLREEGWKVVRIWEDSVKKPSTVKRLRKALL